MTRENLVLMDDVASASTISFFKHGKRKIACKSFLMNKQMSRDGSHDGASFIRDLYGCQRNEN